MGATWVAPRVQPINLWPRADFAGDPIQYIIAGMIVIFGASSDIGRKLAAALRDGGEVVRTVSRRDGDLVADLSSGIGVSEALAGATTVVSCAHARFTKRLIEWLPSTVTKVVLTGSAWRYSMVENPRADEVRDAETFFLASGRDGVMLHPTMIYGGRQETNVTRLLSVIRRFPVIPAPGGGRHQVQPIYIDDVVASLLAAVKRQWTGPNVIPIGGPPLTWRDMAGICAQSIGRSRYVVSIPMRPLLLALQGLHACGIRRFDPGIIRRFSESVNVPLSMMRDELAVTPRDFRVGIGLAVSGWRRQGGLS